MAIEQHRWENKRQVDTAGMNETGRLPVEAMARFSDKAFFQGYKIVTGFQVTVRQGNDDHLRVAPGFAFPGTTPNLPIDLEAEQFAHVLSGANGVDGFGDGLAADPNNPRWDLVLMRRIEPLTTTAAKWFVDDTVDPVVYYQKNTSTRINLGGFEGNVAHGQAAAQPQLPAIPAGWVCIAAVLIPAGCVDLNQATIYDTTTPTSPNPPPNGWPPWPPTVRSSPLDQRVSKWTAGAGLGQTNETGEVTGFVNVESPVKINNDAVAIDLPALLTLIGQQGVVPHQATHRIGGSDALPAGTTALPGLLQLATDAEVSASKAVAANDSRLGGAGGTAAYVYKVADLGALNGAAGNTAFNVSANPGDTPKMAQIVIELADMGIYAVSASDALNGVYSPVWADEVTDNPPAVRRAQVAVPVTAGQFFLRLTAGVSVAIKQTSYLK